MLRQIARNTVFALALAGGVATASYAAEPTLHQVFEAVQAGKLGEADTMMAEVLKAHPDSAKAHFVHAEVLTREGRRDEAREALATAEKLEPGLTFAKPSAVAHLREMINGNAAAMPVADGAPRGGHSLMPILIGVGGLMLVMFVVRAMSARRNAANYPTSYGAGYGGAQGGPYAPGPYSGGPYGGGPAPMGGSGPGLGSSLASGLAVGAGIAAGEALVHRVMDGNRTADPGAGFGTAGFTQANRGVPEDQDFGVNDSSSWGDNSGYVDGGDLGGGDIGGDDWS